MTILKRSAQLFSDYDRITSAIRDSLHWLPVQQRIDYKLCLLVCKQVPAPGSTCLFCLNCVGLFQLHFLLVGASAFSGERMPRHQLLQD